MQQAPPAIAPAPLAVTPQPVTQQHGQQQQPAGIYQQPALQQHPAVAPSPLPQVSTSVPAHITHTAERTLRATTRCSTAL